MKKPTSNWPCVWIAFAITVVLSGCQQATTLTKSTPPPKPDYLAFPPPPETARYYFEMSLVNSVQIKEQAQSSRWKELLTGETPGGQSLGKPFDVAACGGRVYVSDTVLSRVAVFDFPAGKFFEIGTEEPGELVKPLGINTDASCHVYVVDASDKRVVVYDKDGVYITAIGGGDWFHRISHVAATPDGSRIYAVDTGGVQTQEHRIRVFDVTTGAHLLDIGTRGSGDGQLNLPRDIEVAPNGRVYVVDGGNFRVQVFEKDGKFVKSFGQVGTRYGQFSRPKGIASDPNGLIYVSDAAFGNFQIFDAEGQLLLFIGERSNTFGRAKYLLPAGIDADEDGRIYVVDQFYRKVDIFRPATLEDGAGALRGKQPQVTVAQ